VFDFLGELLNQLKQLDTDVTHSLLDVSRKLNSQDGSKEVNPFIQFKKLLLSSTGQKEFDTLVSSIQEGMFIQKIHSLRYVTRIQ
jgi:hypothetical protein